MFPIDLSRLAQLFGISARVLAAHAGDIMKLLIAVFAEEVLRRNLAPILDVIVPTNSPDSFYTAAAVIILIFCRAGQK